MGHRQRPLELGRLLQPRHLARPVAPPSRRGFGSTIIEQTIPHELKGTARIDFAPAGLTAHFTLPPAQIAYFAAPEERPADASREDAALIGDTPLSGHVMILEDNMLIALESEEMLQNLGNRAIASGQGHAVRLRDRLWRNVVRFRSL